MENVTDIIFWIIAIIACILVIIFVPMRQQKDDPNSVVFVDSLITAKVDSTIIAKGLMIVPRQDFDMLITELAYHRYRIYKKEKNYRTKTKLMKFQHYWEYERYE